MIYSQSFLFSALREDSSKSNSRALRSASGVPFLSVICFHFSQKAILFSVTVGLCVFVCSGRRSQQRHPSDGPSLSRGWHCPLGVLLSRGGPGVIYFRLRGRLLSLAELRQFTLAERMA